MSEANCNTRVINLFVDESPDFEKVKQDILARSNYAMPPICIRYGRCIRWSIPFAGKMTVEISGCATPEEAKEKAIEYAKSLGWTPARWWQWWRWRDTKITP